MVIFFVNIFNFVFIKKDFVKFIGTNCGSFPITAERLSVTGSALGGSLRFPIRWSTYRSFFQKCNLCSNDLPIFSAIDAGLTTRACFSVLYLRNSCFFSPHNGGFLPQTKKGLPQNFFILRQSLLFTRSAEQRFPPHPTLSSGRCRGGHQARRSHSGYPAAPALLQGGSWQ